MRLRRRLLAFAVVLTATLVVPAVASAHVAGIEYKFPLPIWLYAAAGGVAVLASAPAAAVAVRGGGDKLSRGFYRRVAPLRLGAAGTAIALVLSIVVAAGGIYGVQLFGDNPATVVVWVDFWVGLGVVSALVGNLWDFVSPLSLAGRGLDRLLARGGVATRPYPEWLGAWPAVVLLLAWSWAELVWPEAQRPRTLVLLLALYGVAQLLAMGLFGAEVWLARGELFTVFARTLARFAPLELYVGGGEGPCPAGRCRTGSERVDCPACWLRAQRSGRGLRLRWYGSGVRREPSLGAGGSAFVVVLLATVVYDGWRSTRTYADLDGWLAGKLGGLPAYSEQVGTLTLILVVAVFSLAFIVVCAVLARFEGGSAAELAARYAPTLIPIAAVYFIAHYFLYLFYLGQLTPGLVLDPFEREWVPDYRPWTGVPGAFVWYLQAGLIVWGHVVAVVEAHRVALPSHRRPRRAMLMQLPLVALMVAYTFSGLWVLGQALQGAA